MPSIEVSGIDIFFDDQGSGPAIVLGHSFLCDGNMWALQLAELSKAHRVINIDLPGHGQSGPAPRPMSITDLVTIYVAVLDHVGLKKAVWAGLSIGGMVALRAALAHPDRVSALILLDTDAGAETSYRRLKYRLMSLAARAFGMRPLVPFVTPIMFGKTTLRDRPSLVEDWSGKFASVHVPSMVNILSGLVDRNSILPKLSEIDVPALIMVGEEDASLPPVRSQSIAAELPRSVLIKVPKAGHLSALEQPDAVNAAILEFLGKISNSNADCLPQRT